MTDMLPHRAGDFGAFVVGAAFDPDGTAGFALGDGRLARVTRAGTDFQAQTVHQGAILSLSAARAGFITGGDDGRVMLIPAGGEAREILRLPRKWVDHVATFGDGKSWQIAAAAGREVHLLGPDLAVRRVFTHGSTVGGIAFDAKGKRLAASHYNGVSLWFTQATTPTPRLLEWKGSHLHLAIAPGGDAVVTAMQENALHGWRLGDGQHMRMTGYPAKTISLDFSHNGRWLASSGADAIVLWPFFGGGPMGKPPREIGFCDNVLVTRVACHPSRDIVAAGYADGSVRLADIQNDRELELAPAQGSPVSALCWAPDGRALAFGTEAGRAVVLGM